MEAARRTGVRPEDVRRILDALFGKPGDAGVIAEALLRRERIVLAGFGTFATRDRAKRMARNPQTRQPIEIPAAVTATFHPSGELRVRLKAVPLRMPGTGR
jgi:DNA-binding protein HU-beta